MSDGGAPPTIKQLTLSQYFDDSYILKLYLLGSNLALMEQVAIAGHIYCLVDDQEALKLLRDDIEKAIIQEAFDEIQS